MGISFLEIPKEWLILFSLQPISYSQNTGGLFMATATVSQPIDLALLDKVLEEFDLSEPGLLIPILQRTQAAYGYLPEPVLVEIANRLKVPVANVFGVVTFYAQFHLHPRGKNIIRSCQGTACHVRGGKTILRTISEELGIEPGETSEDLKFTLETVACIGACGLAPVMTVNENTHGRLTPEKVKDTLAEYAEQEK